MREHKKWICIVSYFSKISIEPEMIDGIKDYIDKGKNILIMIKKEDSKLNPKYTPKEKFKYFCDIFPNETKTGKIIISSVPDITEFIDID